MHHQSSTAHQEPLTTEQALADLLIAARNVIPFVEHVINDYKQRNAGDFLWADRSEAEVALLAFLGAIVRGEDAVGK
jgi:hypothetical protein